MVHPTRLISYRQRVCSLYKQACRLVEGYYVERHVVRYHQVLLRNRFDKNWCIKDEKEQRRLMYLGYDELFQCRHPVPLAKFPKSLGIAGGVAHGRVVDPPDWVLDYWHPLEKAQYPEYFKTREIRKKEYVCLWENNELY